MKKLLNKEVCGSHEQYMRPTENWKQQQKRAFPKKKKKNLETQMFAADVYPNAYSMWKKKKKEKKKKKNCNFESHWSSSSSSSPSHSRS